MMKRSTSERASERARARARERERNLRRKREYRGRQSGKKRKKERKKRADETRGCLRTEKNRSLGVSRRNAILDLILFAETRKAARKKEREEERQSERESRFIGGCQERIHSLFFSLLIQY